VQIAVLCALRFPIEFVREVPATLLGLTTVQVACIGGFGFFAWRLRRLLAKSERSRVAVALAT
jgi:hypothetical protein